MAVDVIARLRLKAEDFSRGVRAAFAPLPAEADKAGREAGTRMGTSLGAGLKGALAGIGVGAIINEIAQATSRAIDFATEIDRTSKALNVGAVDLQVYRAAASELGVATQEADGGLQKMFETIVQSSDPTSKQAEALNALGISIKTVEGNARPTTAVLGDVIDALRAIDDPIKQAALGGKLFGSEWSNMAPLLNAVGGGFRALTEDVAGTTDALSAEEIAELKRINADLDQMKQTLQIDVSRTVAANKDAILSLASGLTSLAITAGEAARAWSYFLQLDFTPRIFGGKSISDQFDDFARKDALRIAQQNLTFSPEETASRLALERSFKLGPQVDARFVGARTNGRQNDPFTRQLPASPVDPANQAVLRNLFSKKAPVQDERLAPPVAFTPRSRAGGGGGRPRGGAANDNAATREAEKLAREWDRIAESTARQLTDARESADIEALRAAGLDRQAELQESLNRIANSNAAIAGKSAAQIADQFKISEEAAARVVAMLAEMQRLAEVEVDLKIDAERLEKFERDFAGFAERLGDQAGKAIEAASEAQQRQFEDLSDTFYTLFAGGTDDFWDYFKRRGQVTLADLAAQLTLKALSGEGSAGDITGALKDLFSAKSGDIGSIFEKGALGSRIGGAVGLKQSNTGAAVGSAIGSLIPQLGPFGAALGGLLGGALGGALKKTQRGSATLGTGQFGELGTASVRGNSAQFKSAASASVDSLGGELSRIAELLGGAVDPSRASVSIGIREGNFRVDTSGQGRTKTKRGAIDFGEDEQAAIRFALGDAIKDGVITGVSAASQRLLQKGGDIEAQLEKALLIEDLPKRLRARLDPLGAALDEVDKKFVKLAEALREGGGSAEQIAEARQLWELERADTIREVGQASQVLADYLKSLRVGPDSPLSLRQQAQDAEKAFAPFEAQVRAANDARANLAALEASRAGGGNVTDADIAAAKSAAAAAAAAIDQTGFREAASVFLDVQRQLGGSTRLFFDQFDRVQGLTSQAIALVDNAVPLRGETKDPFAELTANSTKATANILEQHTGILAQQNEYLEQIMRAFELSGVRFALDPRGFVDRAA